MAWLIPADEFVRKAVAAQSQRQGRILIAGPREHFGVLLSACRRLCQRE